MSKRNAIKIDGGPNAKVRRVERDLAVPQGWIITTYEGNTPSIETLACTPQGSVVAFKEDCHDALDLVLDELLVGVTQRTKEQT